MDNTKAFQKLSQKRFELEEQKEILDNKIQSISEEAKKLKKGSNERKELMSKVEEIKNSKEYQDLHLQIKTMNYCINTVFYN